MALNFFLFKCVKAILIAIAANKQTACQGMENPNLHWRKCLPAGPSFEGKQPVPLTSDCRNVMLTKTASRPE